MKITIWTKTEANSHQTENQDFVIYEKNQWDQLVLGIADGVGSLKHSKKASQLVCQILKNHFLKTDFSNLSADEIEAWGKNLIQKTIYQELQKFSFEIATTFSFVIIVKKYFYFFHVGNTRIFQINQSKIQQITVDHVQENPLLDTFSWLKRENILNNVISNQNNCFVDFSVLPFDIDGLLLTTDGIHDFITLDKLSETFIAKKNTNQSFNLFKKTYLNGSLDDKTFLYAKIS